jgi:putative hemolysin
LKRALFVVLIAGLFVLTACGAEPSAVPPTEVLPALPTSVPPTEAAPTVLPPTHTPADESFDSPLATGAATEETFESPLGMPNPASAFCVEQGYRLEIRTEADGEAGYCIFPDGSECEEWAFLRDECAPETTP